MLYPRDTYFVSFIVQRNTQNNRFFMLTCENEQFHLLGPFSLNALVKRVGEIYRQDDCINDGKKKTFVLFFTLLISIVKWREKEHSTQEVSSQECVYRCMPELWLGKIFPGTVFVSTDLPEKRVHVTKSKQELEDLDDDSTYILLSIYVAK